MQRGRAVSETEKQTRNGGNGNTGETPVVEEIVDAVTEGLADAGILSEQAVQSAQNAVRRVEGALDRAAQKAEQKLRAAAQRAEQKTWTAAQNAPPRQVNQTVQNRTNGQQNTGYRYAPPTGAAQTPRYVRPVPPPRANVPTRPVVKKPQTTAQQLPKPPQPKTVVKRKPTNLPYWFVGILCVIYALNLPLFRWTHFAAFAAVALGGFLLGKYALFKGKKVVVPVEEEKKEPPKVPEKPKAPEAPKRASTGNPEVDKIIEEGYGYLKKLREENDRIPDTVMSERITRMENASADIFAYISEHPDQAPQIRRFMNYYLPTTLKLLESYEKLSRQRVKGENIQRTMFEIEGIMETIASAFEKQLDALFSSDAMDIAADISVMESILQQEGLVGAAAPETKSAGGAAQQSAPSAPGIPTLTFDPNADDEGN